MKTGSVRSEKIALQTTIVITSIFAACVSILCGIYLWRFDGVIRTYFEALTPTIIAVLVISFACMLAVLHFAWKSSPKILLAMGIILISHLIYYKLIHSFINFTIDDTFITFRYSHNLAKGYGPTFNPGRMPVEGYTTFLWMLIMSIPHLLSMDALVFSKLLGIALGELTIIFAMLISSEICDVNSPHYKLMAGTVTSLFIAAFYPMAIHSISGMETILFTAILSAVVYCAILPEPNKKTAILTAGTMLMLGLTRPEGNLLNAGILLVALLTRPQTQRRILLYTTLLFYVLPGMVYFYWRMSYYQLLLPLPYYAKLGAYHRPAGIADVAAYILTILPSIIFFLLYTFRQANPKVWVIATPIILLLVFYLFPMHIMGIYSRFIFPSSPLIYTLAGAGVINFFVTSQWFEVGDKSIIVKTLLGIGGIGLIALSPLANITTTIKQSGGERNPIAPYIYFGRYLKAFPSTRQMTLAIGDAGAIPYYSEWNIIDLTGLTDPNTLFASSRRRYLDYVFRNGPDLVILTFNDPEKPVRDARISGALYEAALAKGMKKIGVIKISDTYYLWVFAEPGTQLEEYLQQAF